MDRSSALAARFSPTKADIALKAKQDAMYVKDLWILLASVVALLTLVRTLRLALSWLPRRAPTTPAPSEKTDLESVESGRTGKISWRRVPAAVASTFRVVAFRIGIPVGFGSVTSVAELLFILGYIASMLVFVLIDSEIHSSLI